MDKITKWLFGGKDQLFFIENAKIINAKNIKSLRSVVVALTILQVILFLAGVLFNIRRDLAPVYAIFGVLFLILWILIHKTIKNKQYQAAEKFLPIVVLMSYAVAIYIGTIGDPNGRPIMTIAVSILLPILFITPLAKTLSYIVIAFSLFTTFDIIAKGDLAFNLFQLSLYTFFGILVGQVKLRTEITAIEEHNQLSTDSLTGIRNSKYLDDIIELIKWNNHVCVGIIDIDFFKAYNDFAGHDQGDEILKRVATTLNSFFSENGITLMRRSEAGDEFIFVATGSSAEDIVKKRPFKSTTTAKECLDLIASLEIILPFQKAKAKHITEYKNRYGDQAPTAKYLSISGGYYLYEAKNGGKNLSTSQAKHEIDTMLKKADIALQAAKDAGRNRFCGNDDIKDLPAFKDLLIALGEIVEESEKMN